MDPWEINIWLSLAMMAVTATEELVGLESTPNLHPEPWDHLRVVSALAARVLFA
jgi:hypothetical protein